MAPKKRRRQSLLGGPEVNEMLLAALSEGALSTKQLASELGVVHGDVFSRCRRLEDKGLLKSKLMSGHGALYCIDDARVVSRSEYEGAKRKTNCARLTEERVWSLP